MSYLAVCLAALAVAQPHAKLTYHTRLEGAARMPVIVSPDGRSILYFAEDVAEEDGENRPSFRYCLANIDGTKPKTLSSTLVDWDDYLNAVTHERIFSADGRRIAIAVTDNGHRLRAKDNPGRVVPAICDLAGNLEQIDCEKGSTGGFGFAGNDFVWLDTPGLNSGQGYQLKIIKEGKPKIINADKSVAAHGLRISPDGSRAVFFVSQHVLSSIVRMRQVNLATGEVTQSPEFRSQEATFDGRPQLFWDAAGEGVFCHVSIHPQSKWPFELTHYNFETGQGRVASPTRNIGASAVLDDDHVAMWHPDAGGCTVLRLSDRKEFALPDHNYILGGRGPRVVVADLERDAVYAAELTFVDEE